MNQPHSWAGEPLAISQGVWRIILGFTLLRLLLAAILPLTPQEAYYWSWSLDLDWSYFDHPPLASYSIALTTVLLGHTIFAVKLAAVLWWVGLNLLWARLILDMFRDQRLAFWSLIALNLTIVYELYGFVISPDTPLVFAWVGTTWSVWRVCQTEDYRWWYAAGFFMGLAWLGKYTGILLVPSILLFFLLSRRQRHWPATPHPYLASLLAVAVFSPVLIWNAQHEWVSFVFQGSRRTGGMHHFRPRFFVELIGSQLFMLSPYFLVMVVGRFIQSLRQRDRLKDDDRLLLLFFSGGLTLLFFTLVSFRTLVKMNWLAVAYWPFIILGVRHVLQRKHGWRRFQIGLISAGLFFILGLSVVTLPNVPLGDGNTWSGWRAGARKVENLKAELAIKGQDAFIFSTNYKVASLLRFYLDDHPRTYAQAIYDRPALQFDFWEVTEPLVDQTGILVVDDRREYRFRPERIEPFFSDITHIDSLIIQGFGQQTRRIDFYLCRDYSGHPRQVDMQHSEGNDL